MPNPISNPMPNPIPNPKSYESKYCSKDTKVTASQYLAELMCERSARQKNIELPDHFWKTKKWNQLFRRHITQCNRLLQQYPIEALVRAFKDTRTQNFLSFGNKRFIPIIRHHAVILQSRDNRELEETVVSYKVEKPRKPLGRKSTFTKLREQESLDEIHKRRTD